MLDDIILQQESNESPEDYRSRILTDGKLDTLIFELSTPLPDPEPQEEIEEEAVQSNKEEDEIPHQDEMKIEAEEGMPEEFLLDDLEELPMAEFSFDEMPMEEFSFGEELPASNSSSETVLETQSEEQNAEAFSIENEEMIVVEMDSEKTADQVEDLPIQNEEMVIEGSETIEHVDLTEQEAVGENMKMVEEKEEEVVEEKQATPEPDPIPAPTTKKPTSSRKNGKNNAIFGEAKAAGNKSVSADQFSLF
ncbi:hypothetical protein [Aneurinibacillus tyrosinisolvens]|uniref:hypothetical protein n=1 Tax=Aneurinibacillus tyrosinisolvens TaxID=1443435 RepID=UPI00063F681F|nr:hypothetical protein [Aneurinibacillus tyrosinisolvens]